jgi:hypothetical protein
LRSGCRLALQLVALNAGAATGKIEKARPFLSEVYQRSNDEGHAFLA